MKKLLDLSTVSDVDAFIDDQICRDMPLLRARAESREFTPAERAVDQKLDAVLKALARRAELQKGVHA